MSDIRAITIPREEDPFHYLITLFSILRVEASDRDWIQEGNSVKWIPKEPNVIHFDYEELRVKIMTWLGDKTSFTSLQLNDEESALLRLCSHAAYYFVTEDGYPKNKRPDKFITFHETYFR